jgi:preprotein translocase subunit SecA
VNSVNAFEPRIQALSDDQLAAKTEEFRLRLKRGETLADIQAGSLFFYSVFSLL